MGIRMRAERDFSNGMQAFSSGNLTTALKLFGSAKEGFRQAGDRRGAIQARGNQGEILRLMGRYAEAVEAFGEIRAESVAVGDEYERARSSNNIGAILLESDHAQARIYLSEAYDFCPRHGEGRRLLPFITANLGRLAVRQGQAIIAIRWLKESLDQADAISDTEGVIDALVELIQAQMLLLQFEAALDTCSALEERVETSGRVDLATRAFAIIAKVYSAAARPEEAVRFVDRAISAQARAPLRDRLMALVIAADVYFSADLWDRANSAVADALRAIPAQLPRLRASALLTKAKTALAEDDTPGAAAAISEIQGLSLDDPRLDAMVFALASEEAAARSDIAEAEKFMSASLGLFQDVTANSVPSLGAESIGLLEWHTHTFRRLEDHALTRHDLADAVRTSDAGRARLLFSKLSSEPAIGSQISKPADPVVVASRTSATIVMYASGPGRRPHLRVPLARAYVISPAGDINVRTLPDEENWDAWNLGSLAQLANEDERADLISIEFLSRLTELYAALIEPIEDLLPAPGSSVVIVPDNFTHMVPFAALSPAQGPSLLDRYVLSFAPSAAVLGALQARASRRRRSSGAAVIGSRAMGASRLAPHMKEVEQVARMYGTRPLLDIEPSAFSAAVSDVDVIHIAAHAALGGRYHYGYVPGALYLAGIGDDALTVKSVEIEELSVSARVVVLSACVSGLGHILPEGVIGLARAFLVAGASSIIASLWPVRTWSTAALMHDLHTQLSAGVAAAPALRNAMLACRDRYEDPIDWAPFALIGLN